MAQGRHVGVLIGDRGRQRSHDCSVTPQVDISIELRAKNIVRIRVSNFGIGIPPERLDEIKDSGGRAMVPDTYHPRPGTGRGLLIASGVLEDHGGFLDIRSEPADDEPRTHEELYHRYVTTVDAYLPIIL